MSTRRIRLKDYGRDSVLLILGVSIFLKEAGIFWPPPQTVSIPLLLAAGLLCNGPVFLSALTIWRTSPPQERPESSEPVSPSPESSTPPGSKP